MNAGRAVFWFRRDLRIEDNAGLYHALKSGFQVQCIFIFDRTILEALENPADARVSFIYSALERVEQGLQQAGASLEVFYGRPEDVWRDLIGAGGISAVYANEDYEPYARKRDAAVKMMLNEAGIAFHRAKDHVIFRHNEVLKADETPYTVFTPYSKRWKATLTPFHLKPYPTKAYLKHLQPSERHVWPTLQDMGFLSSDLPIPDANPPLEIIDAYHLKRDLPSEPGTTRLSVHLRFGTTSIRRWAAIGLERNEKWLNELIWRDFYQMILWHFPHTPEMAFKPAYDHISWEHNEDHFKAWIEGKTGYPLVDAGMRELEATGFMHNRVRMVVASFFTKHLLLDWRLGERWFARKLLDFELASNVGGWQWAARSGNDAAPYFRVFNPALQLQKFDPQLTYVKKWVPEYGTPLYPKPIVDHVFARNRALSRYKEALA